MQNSPPKYAPECVRLNGRIISVTARNHSTRVFKRRGLLILFFYKYYLLQNIYVYFGWCLAVFYMQEKRI